MNREREKRPIRRRQENDASFVKVLELESIGKRTTIHIILAMTEVLHSSLGVLYGTNICECDHIFKEVAAVSRHT